MVLSKQPPRTQWGPLVVTSSLAAAVATVGSFVSDRLKGNNETTLRRCEIASDLLLKAQPAPYMDRVRRTAITREAESVIYRCLREGS